MMDELQVFAELWATVVADLWVMADTPAYLNIFGLGLDIIGVIIIFKYGLPADIRRGGITLLATEQTDPEEAANAAKYDRWSMFGLIVLITGFLLQAAGSATLLAKS